MSTEHNESGAAVVMKSLALIGAWFGTVTLAQVQTFVAIISGLAVLVYTVINTYYLIRRNRQGK